MTIAVMMVIAHHTEILRTDIFRRRHDPSMLFVDGLIYACCRRCRLIHRGGLLMLLHLVHYVRSIGKRKGSSHIVPHRRTGRYERIVHQRIDTVRWWTQLDGAPMAANTVAVVIAIGCAGARSTVGAIATSVVVAVHNEILVHHLQHTGLPWR